MDFLGKHFFMCHFQSATLPVHLFGIVHVLSYYFSQGFSLNFYENFKGRAVDKLLNGSRVTSHRQFIFGKQSLSLFRGYTALV